MIFSNHKLRRERADTVCSAVVENPTYFLARNMLADAGVVAKACPIDKDGMQVELHAGPLFGTLHRCQNRLQLIVAATG